MKLLEEAKTDPILDDSAQTYKATLVTALADGMITSDEEAMLETLRESLGITDVRHANMLAELLDKTE
jgi:tellurite resistance protein